MKGKLTVIDFNRINLFNSAHLFNRRAKQSKFRFDDMKTSFFQIQS